MDLKYYYIAQLLYYVCTSLFFDQLIINFGIILSPRLLPGSLGSCLPFSYFLFLKWDLLDLHCSICSFSYHNLTIFTICLQRTYSAVAFFMTLAKSRMIRFASLWTFFSICFGATFYYRYPLKLMNSISKTICYVSSFLAA